MNRRPPGYSASKSLVGFLQFKTAEALSNRTIETYQYDLSRWIEYAGDPVVAKVKTTDLRAYFAWLMTGYKPRRFTGSTQPLSTKTVRNIYITLSSFFRWASEEFKFENPMKGIPAPKFETAPVEPFTREDVEALLKVCEQSIEAKTSTRRKFSMTCHAGYRNQSIILILLDTGLRASELCALNMGDLDQKTGRLEVKHGVGGGAKGRKGRVVYLGKACRRTVWRYLASRTDEPNGEAPLLLGREGRRLNRDALRQQIASLGQRAHVKKCHPHRFRHTFAITYLRSGGDVFTLQSLLGHSTLDMVQHYARIAQTDVELAHRRASPADNWHL